MASKQFLKFLAFILVFLQFKAFGQIENPVSWKTKLTIEGDAYILTYSATIDKGWHLYSFDIAPDGPVPTTLNFDNKKDISVIGNPITNRKPLEKHDQMFDMNIKYFEGNVEFRQKIILKKNIEKITGYIEFMSCNDEKCLPPEQERFEFSVKKSDQAQNDLKPTTTNITVNTQNFDSLSPKKQTESLSITNNSKASVTSTTTTTTIGLWYIFFAGFIGGLLALLTPCVFPMIPLTVSFFLKRGKSQIRSAILYGISIILIYVSLGFIITLIFGPDAMNALSTNPTFNVFLFALLIIFGASFLGAFELQLPTSWSNYFDRKTDTTSGLISIFFMAFTLGLVSFSCTGPIIGTLLVQAAVSGSTIGPLAGMFGFSLALALPFTFFAIFPTFMNKLPRSGGWLNTVKVVLGFLELAFALKFLSTADLAAHWGILPRETFLVLWIILFALLGMYLLNLIKFAHDSESSHVTVPRFFMAVISLSFSLYMIPGLWGAPLKAISAFSPPLQTQDFDLYTKTLNTGNNTENITKKYNDIFHSPYGLNSFFDYEEGMAYAKKVGKPVILDFTGHGCVNCRKMEVSVWSDKKVLNLLNKEYVLISLYVDDRTLLPENEQKTVTLGNKTMMLKTIGNKWSYFQAKNYGTNSQPYYVLLDNNGNLLTPPVAYDLNIETYVHFLEKGIEIFKKR